MQRVQRKDSAGTCRPTQHSCISAANHHCTATAYNHWCSWGWSSVHNERKDCVRGPRILFDPGRQRPQSSDDGSRRMRDHSDCRRRSSKVEPPSRVVAYTTYVYIDDSILVNTKIMDFLSKTHFSRDAIFTCKRIHGTVRGPVDLPQIPRGDHDVGLATVMIATTATQ